MPQPPRTTGNSNAPGDRLQLRHGRRSLRGRRPRHRLVEHQHPDYHGADSFDHYNTGLLREADTLVLAGRRSFLGNMEYWSGVLEDPDAPPIRREFARLILGVEKVVVSGTIAPEDVAPYPADRPRRRRPPRGDGAQARGAAS